MSTRHHGIPFLHFVILIASVGSAAWAQTQSASHIVSPIEDGILVTLKGNVHPLAQPRFDQGAVPDSFPAERMLLILQRPPERETALRQFLQDVHTPGSPSYHHWLTPDQFGKLYGPNDSDVMTISGWLEQHGFTVARVSRGKTAIEFSGGTGQLREAFKTEIHTYLINGQEHHANNRDLQIPAALAPVIAGITPLNDFHPKPQMKILGKAMFNPRTREAKPQWTSNQYVFLLAPGDFAVEYNLNPLYNAGLNGSGVVIGIISASNVDPVLFANYRTLFGLPTTPLNVIIDGNDPGPSATIFGSNYATGEADLDVEVSGGVAPGASINLYAAADTTVQSGLLLAAQRAVDDDQAAVLSTSYGDCEQELGAAGNQFWAALWEQAAAQGQTSLVASGDSGSAGCDNFGAGQPAQDGLAVNGYASTPWNVSVGGTDFFYTSYNGSAAAQEAELGTYWNLNVTGDTPTTSLLKPIPEQPWNIAFGLNLSSGGVYDPTSPIIVAGSGGASHCITATCNAGYPKPAWQSGPGVPADGARDIPDVSLFAADGTNATGYPICVSEEECASSTAWIFADVVGGTSASAPAMAGIMAIINRKYGRQGQANFTLYPLAVQHPSAFHDITMSSNNVPCQASSISCKVSTRNDNTKGFFTLGAYYATPGYDQSTGLGSVDANLLVQNWNSLTFTPTGTALSFSQTSFTHGTPVNVNVAVTGNGGTPSGDVGLATTASPAVDTGLDELTLKSGTASATLNNLPGGQYELTAKYTGDTTFAPSSSTPVSLNVTPEASTVSLSGNYWDTTSSTFLPLSASSSYPYGSYIAIAAQPRGVNTPAGSQDGLPTGTVSFTGTGGGGTLSSGNVNLNVNGLAEWQPATAFPAGTNSLNSSYSGDASFGASTSTKPLTLNITRAVPNLLLSADPHPAALGGATTLNLNVYLASGWPGPTLTYSLLAPPTGTATFSLGSTVLGTAPLVPGGGSGSGNAYASASVTGLPVGVNTVTLNYSGDGNYAPATGSGQVTVKQPANLTASANPSSFSQDQSTTVTATVAQVKGQPIPTGSVTCQIALLSEDMVYGEFSATLLNGSAVCPLTDTFFPAVSGASVIVSYSGDNVYVPAQVNVPLKVTFSSAVFLSGTSVAMQAGARTGNTSTITVGPYNFTGTVGLSCALASYPSGAQYLPGCSIPPSVKIAPPGIAASTASMSIISIAPSSSMMRHPDLFRPSGPAAGAVTVLLALLLMSMMIPRPRLRLLGGLMLVAVLVGVLATCGGGSGGGGGGGGNPSTPGTTAGAYTFTVTGLYTASNGPAQVQTTVGVAIH